MPERSLIGTFFLGVSRLITGLSSLVKLAVLVLVLFFLLGMVTAFMGKPGEADLKESFYAGDRSARDKIAIVHIDGVLMEGFNAFAIKQIDAAAADDDVKAVVVRINSPGGTITASADLHRRLNDLRLGMNRKHPGNPKPIVVSMGNIAASGGYYVAMIKSDPPTPVLAEPDTTTGSIGVYLMLPNVKKLADKHGVEVSYIKAGDIKASGSPFLEMTEHEKEVWQNSVDHAYLRFLAVIEEARSPALTRDTLQADVTIDETLAVRHGLQKQKQVSYKRYRADGGIFTAAQAHKLKLVDKIGDLMDAIDEARRLGDVGQNYKAITYDRPATLLGLLMGNHVTGPVLVLDANRLAGAVTPRMWYLAPQHEMAGILTALSR
jgi:protease-4